MATPFFYGRIKQDKKGDNQIRLDYRRDYQRYLNQTFKKDQPIKLSIKKNIKKRTTGQGDEKSNQNGYLWGVVIPILADHFGYTDDEMLDALRPLFFFEVSDKNPKVKRLLSTTLYNTKEWEDKMEDIRVWALKEEQVYIPEPHEVDYDELKSESGDMVVTDETAEKVIEQSKNKLPAPKKPEKHKHQTKTNPTLISDLIKMFEEVNPSTYRLYGMKTQREAMDRLVLQHGEERVRNMIRALPQCNSEKYAPTITTPNQLEANLGKLIAWGQKKIKSGKKVGSLKK